MKELVVISGKGGTGKTSIAASLAVLSDRCIVIDCDVDAPNLHMVLEPQTIRQYAFVGGSKAYIHPSDCWACGRCVELCRFGAIRRSATDGKPNGQVFVVDPLTCEGCGVCVDHCPSRAVELRPYLNGQWFVSRFRRGHLFHAVLDVGSENSGKLVTQLRRAAWKFAEEKGVTLLVTDGPPGIGCPVIASLTGASLALIVTEPTVSGLHDFERIARLCLRLGVPALTVINKADLNNEMAKRIAGSAPKLHAEVLAVIPFDPDVLRAQVAARSVVEVSDGPAARTIKAMYSEIVARLSVAPDVYRNDIVSISTNMI